MGGHLTSDGRTSVLHIPGWFESTKEEIRSGQIFKKKHQPGTAPEVSLRRITEIFLSAVEATASFSLFSLMLMVKLSGGMNTLKVNVMRLSNLKVVNLLLLAGF